MGILKFWRTSTKDIWCITIPKWRITTDSEAELLQLRIKRMRSFDYIRMESKEDTYEFYVNYHLVSAKNIRNIARSVNKFIDNIKKN